MTEPTDRGDVVPSSDEDEQPHSSRSSHRGHAAEGKHRRTPTPSGRQMPFWQELALLLAVVANGFTLVDISPTYDQLFQGGVILTAILLDALLKRKAR